MRLVALLILALTTMAAPASAQEESKTGTLWRRLGIWSVYAFRDDHYCFVSSGTQGPEIFIGYNPRRKFGFALTHPAWRSLEVGKTYPMTVQIDDQQYPGIMDAWKRPDGTSIVLGRTFDEEEQGRRFLQDFQRGSQLSVIYEGRRLATYVLQASQMAGDELMRCQAAQDRAAQDKPDDPFKPRGPAAAPPDKSGASDKSGPTPAAATLPALTPDQRVEAIRMAANLLTKLPGFRLLNEEEQKALSPQIAKFKAAVVWTGEKTYGFLHIIPNATTALVPKIAGDMVGATVAACKGDVTATVAVDVRSPTMRRIHVSCSAGAVEGPSRVIVLPFKDGLYFLMAASDNLKDEDAVIRAEELLRNALFEVAPK